MGNAVASGMTERHVIPALVAWRDMEIDTLGGVVDLARPICNRWHIDRAARSTFEVFHEGALRVSKTAITFEAYRATATRSHPEHPSEDYRDQPRRPETATLTWRFQNTGTQKVLILGGGSTAAVAYHHIGSASSATRARQTPVAPQAPALAHLPVSAQKGGPLRTPGTR